MDSENTDFLLSILINKFPFISFQLLNCGMGLCILTVNCYSPNAYSIFKGTEKKTSGNIFQLDEFGNLINIRRKFLLL